MNTALRKFRSLTAQASFAAATFAIAPSGFTQTAPAPKVPSAACAQQQKNVNEKGLEKFSVPDLIAHPVLAGDTIKIQIRVRDALNKTGQSETCAIKLPAQEFRHPVAKAMVGLRRTLAISPKKSHEVAKDFDRILTEKSVTIQNPKTLEDLKALQRNIAAADNVEALEAGVRGMWELMQRLEQENMSAAEKRLREVEQALREALRRGADQEQIRELTSEAMKAMKDALKEQSDKAKQNPQDPQAQKDLEDMQKRLEDMQKMLDELQNVDKKTAQDMQKMMQQMQELMKQQQQMQQEQDAQQSSQSQQSQQSQQNQQQQQKQMRQSMQQRMQQMQQRMQQMQQNQKMQQEMSDLIKKQEELRNQTAEEREKRKEDMEAVLKQLEEYAKKLRDQIQERRMEEYGNQNELYRRQNNSNPVPADDHQMDGVMNERTAPTFLKAAYREMSLKLAEATPPVPLDEGSIQKRLNRLNEMDENVSNTAKDLGKKRINQEQLRESEAENIIDRFQKIQKELQAQEKEQPPQPDKNQQQQHDQKNQQQQQQEQQQQMLERIKQLMEQMKKKPQNQQQQQQQQQKPMSQEQRDLQKKLQELMEKMRQRGMDPGKLQDADQPMDQSAQELDQNDPGDAIPPQEEVLKNLREGQKQMQQQMQQQMQKKPGQGQGEGQGEGEGDGEHEPSADALGRLPADADAIKIEKDATLSQKRREEIKNLLEQSNLPQATREYYERLLKGKNARPAPSP